MTCLQPAAVNNAVTRAGMVSAIADAGLITLRARDM